MIVQYIDHEASHLYTQTGRFHSHQHNHIQTYVIANFITVTEILHNKKQVQPMFETINATATKPLIYSLLKTQGKELKTVTFRYREVNRMERYSRVRTLLLI